MSTELCLAVCPPFLHSNNVYLEGEQKKYTDVFKSGGNILDHSASKLKSLKYVVY